MIRASIGGEVDAGTSGALEGERTEGSDDMAHETFRLKPDDAGPRHLICIFPDYRAGPHPARV